MFFCSGRPLGLNKARSKPTAGSYKAICKELIDAVSLLPHNHIVLATPAASLASAYWGWLTLEGHRDSTMGQQQALGEDRKRERGSCLSLEWVFVLIFNFAFYKQLLTMHWLTLPKKNKNKSLPLSLLCYIRFRCLPLRKYSRYCRMMCFSSCVNGL